MKKLKKYIYFGIFLSSLIILSGVIKTQISLSYTIENQINRKLISSYIPHGPIIITHDDNFTDHGFLGEGTNLEPYIIENYNITTTSNFGISIRSTTKHFVIRNCYVVTHQHCIYIYDVAEGTTSIINNFCSCSSDYPGGVCIFLYSSSSATVIDNTCINNNGGILLHLSSDAVLMNNNCSKNNVGFILHSSPGATLTNNIICNNYYGIDLEASSDSSLISNQFFNDGLFIQEETVEEYSSYTIQDNLVNDKQLGYYINKNEATFSEPIYGQLIFINCNEIVIENQKLSNVFVGLSLKYCENSLISNNLCDNNSKGGIDLDNSNGTKLTENECSNNGGDGIRLVSSVGATMNDNICSNNRNGIGLYGSNDTELTNNICNDNSNDGVYLGSSRCTLIKNTCSNNGYDGIEASNNSLTQNNCNENRWGIRLWRANSGLFTYNLLEDNEEYGIMISSDSHNNIIHHNSFIDNNLGGTSQAYDEGTNNTWYDVKKKKGNYWLDWNQSGSYLIDGDSDSIDPYPLDKIPKKISSNFVIIIPSIVLLIILRRHYAKKKRVKN